MKWIKWIKVDYGKPVNKWCMCCQHAVPACPLMSVDVGDGQVGECSTLPCVAVHWLSQVMICCQVDMCNGLVLAGWAIVGRITIQYPACLYSPVLVPTVIPQFSFMAQCFFDHKILSLGSTHLFTSIIPISKSIPNLDTIIPSNRTHSYNSNDIHFDSIPILEGKIRHLPVICLHIVTRQTLRVWIRIIRRSKGLFEGIPTQLRSWELVQGKRRYLSCKLGVLNW